jgi:hypothetical protein
MTDIRDQLGVTFKLGQEAWVSESSGYLISYYIAYFGL